MFVFQQKVEKLKIWWPVPVAWSLLVARQHKELSERMMESAFGSPGCRNLGFLHFIEVFN